MTTQLPIKTSSDEGSQTSSEVDQQALAAIRNLLDDEPEVDPQPVAEPQAEKAAAMAEPVQTRPEAAGAMQPQPKVKAKRAKKETEGNGLAGRIKSSIMGYRPTPRHIVLASLALLVVFRPWLVVGLVFLSLFVILTVFLILGYDGFWRRAMVLARWYATRRPTRAAHLHRKLDAFAMRWDAILDLFPEGSVDGLYLPDFGDLATAEARHDDALNRRFADMRENEA